MKSQLLLASYRSFHRCSEALKREKRVLRSKTNIKHRRARNPSCHGVSFLHARIQSEGLSRLMTSGKLPKVQIFCLAMIACASFAKDSTETCPSTKITKSSTTQETGAEPTRGPLPVAQISFCRKGHVQVTRNESQRRGTIQRYMTGKRYLLEQFSQNA